MAQPSEPQYWLEREPKKPWHAKRLATSFQWLQATADSKQQVLEVGGLSEFSRAATLLCNRTTRAGVDRRFQWPEDAESCDGVIAMEILEHICDHSPATIDEASQFNRSGAETFIAESFRVLRPGGWLFLTTPNVCSSLAIANILSGEHPHLFKPHHREYSPAEVRGMLLQVGFRIERNQLIDCYQRSERAKHLMKKHGLPHHGDTFFVLARKDEQP